MERGELQTEPPRVSTMHAHDQAHAFAATASPFRRQPTLTAAPPRPVPPGIRPLAAIRYHGGAAGRNPRRQPETIT